MIEPHEVPHSLLRAPFRVDTALELGVPAPLLRRRGWDRPFWGVRSHDLDLETFHNRLRAYATRLPSIAVFSHTTAARLWSIPLGLSTPEQIHVTVPVGKRATDHQGIRGHQQRMEPDVRRTLGGLPVAAAAATWAQLAEVVCLEDLIAAGEYVLTGNPFKNILPLATFADLEAATVLRASGPGHRKRNAALGEMREGALSRPESFSRILAVRCGIPEPLINTEVVDERGSFVAIPDLSWPAYQVALEYEGDHHRDVGQFRRDIRRIEALIDQGWLVIKVSADDLFDRPRELVERIARRLRSRGWTGTIDLRRLTTFRR